MAGLHSTGMGTETGAVIASPAATRDAELTRLRSAGLPLGLATVVLAGWQLAVTLGHVPPVILPSPVSIGHYIYERLVTAHSRNRRWRAHLR
jgi:NitT/TauT family transport system permease protein